MFTVDIDLKREIAQFYYPFLRATGMMLYLPIFSSFLIPMRIRIIFSVVLAFFVSSLIEFPVIEIFSLNGFLFALTQLLIGYIFSFVIQMSFQALTVAGEAISMSMGLAFAQIVDPSNGHSVPLLSQLFLVFITLYFVSVDMHLLLIQVFSLSFYHIPINQFFNIEILYGLVLSSTVIFSSALLLALPVLASLLSINIIMGVMSRSAPQLNIFTVGFPLTLFLGYVAILLFMTNMIQTFEELIHIQLQYFISILPDRLN